MNFFCYIPAINQNEVVMYEVFVCLFFIFFISHTNWFSIYSDLEEKKAVYLILHTILMTMEKKYQIEN